MGGIGLWKDNYEQKKINVFPVAKVRCFYIFFAFLQISMMVSVDFSGASWAGGDPEDHQSFAPTRIILRMLLPARSWAGPVRHKPHIKPTQLKALWKTQIFSLIFASSWRFPKFLPAKFPEFSAASAQVFVLHFLNSSEWGRSRVRMRSPGSLCSFACGACCQFAYFGTWTLQITPYDQQIRCHLRACVQEMSYIYLPCVLRMDSGVLAQSTRLACLVLFPCQRLHLRACNCLINDIIDAVALSTRLFGHWPELNVFQRYIQ